MRGRGNGRNAPPPPPPRRQLIHMPGIAEGSELLERQGTPEASGMRPRAIGAQSPPTFGGGTSPVKTGDTIHRGDVGKVVEWEADGYIRIARYDYTREAPLDGQTYARQSGQWVIAGTGPGGGIPEAPLDGRNYTRRGFDATWQPLPYILPEAPLDGRGYVRIGLNSTWSPAFTQALADARYAPIGTTGFPEAPSDGLVYGRRGWDHAWIPVASGTGLPEAPVDGYLYVRRGSDASWQLAFTKAQADSLYAAITVISETPPLAALPGDFWFDPVGTQLYVWYNDGTSAQWVVAVNGGGGGTAVALPLAIADGGTGATTSAQARVNLGIVSFPEAPVDGNVYVRRGSDASWQLIPAGGISEAPLTGGPYGRQAGGWVAIDVSGGAFVDAPTDGRWYLRDGLNAMWRPAADLVLDGGVY